jgi:hypothetical protein
LLIVDHQVGLFQLARDYDPTVYKNSVYVALNLQPVELLINHNDSLAYAALGKVFDLPVVMTTSAETGKFALRWLAGIF